MKLMGSLPTALIIASAVGSFTPVPLRAQPAIEPTPFILASGLEGPRGLRFGPDGYLYVAEAGTGGTNSTIGQCTQVPGPPGGPGPDTGGLTARISKISPSGKVTTVASGFPSVLVGPGGANGTIGVADVVFLDGDLYALIGAAVARMAIRKVPAALRRWISRAEIGTSSPISVLG